jgi:hypothetical protein
MYDKDAGAMNRKGKASFGALDEYTPLLKKSLDDIESELSNDDQRGLFRKIRLQQETDFNDSLQRHVFQESRQFQDQTAKATIEAAREDGVMNYHKKGAIEDSLRKQSAFILDKATKEGRDASDPITQLELSESATKTHASIIERMIATGQGPAAKAHLEKYRASFKGTDLGPIERAVEGAMTTEQAVATWQEVRGFRLADGNPDQDRIEKYVMARKDLSTEKKEKIWDYVRSKATEEATQKRANDAAIDHDFKNNLITGKKKGMVLDDALRLADQYGGDEVTKLDRQEIAKKLYTSEIKTDPFAYNGLWRGIQEGRFGEAEINRAFKEGKISGSDYMELTKSSFSRINKYDEQDRKFVLDQVTEMSKELPKKERDDFTYLVLRNSHGKTPQEILKYAKDMKDLTPDSKGAWFRLDEHNYSTRVKQTEAQDLVWGKMDEDLGRGIALEIGRGATFKGKQAWGPGDIEEFASAFGGYDKIKKGTPVNQAIGIILEQNALGGKKYPITPDNVKAVMKKYGLSQ